MSFSVTAKVNGQGDAGHAYLLQSRLPAEQVEQSCSQCTAGFAARMRRLAKWAMQAPCIASSGTTSRRVATESAAMLTGARCARCSQHLQFGIRVHSA